MRLPCRFSLCEAVNMNLHLKHLTVDDYRVMPWKNEGGSTTEIAIYPLQSTMSDSFLWRVSLAQLNGSGPFSSFPGYERSIVQLSGHPMQLIHQDGHPKVKELEPLTPYLFPGEWTTDGKLEGRAEDFNLMLRRDAVSGNLECLQLKANEVVTAQSAKSTLIWVYRGKVVWESQAQRKSLMTRDSLLIEGSGHDHFQLEGTGGDAIVFIARINPKI